VIRYVAVLAVGYVLGTKAGRRRYEQIVRTYKAVTGSPAAKSIIDAGRRKIANRVSPDPDPAMVTLTEIDQTTTVLQPRKAR
jgi:tryptophan synthase beta subunit